jgi:hypothetical protein
MPIPEKARELQVLLTRIIDLNDEHWTDFAAGLQEEVTQLISAARYEIKAAEFAWHAGKPEAAATNLASAREVLSELERAVRHSIGRH